MKSKEKVSKTRDRLIEVAHRLFILKGVENTTMRDIADASDKGRRTLYTYFKSKGDIFNAVIKREGETYLKSLEEIRLSSEKSIKKLEFYIKKRFEVLEIMEKHHNSFLDWLRNGFRTNNKRDILTSIREKDSLILNEIISEGVSLGEFDPEVGKTLGPILPSMIHSAYISPENQGMDYKSSLTSFIISVIKSKPYN